MWQERVVLSEHELIDASVSRRGWRLAYLRRGTPRIAYEGSGGVAYRIEGTRSRPYRFRSVEQLRYDFDRDVRLMRDGEPG